MVFVENLCPKDIIDSNTSITNDSSSDNTDDDGDVVDDKHDRNIDQGGNYTGTPAVDKFWLFYHAAMQIRNKLENIKGLKVPWPPLSSDLGNENAEGMVEPILFNFFAWVFGFSDEATF